MQHAEVWAQALSYTASRFQLGLPAATAMQPIPRVVLAARASFFSGLCCSAGAWPAVAFRISVGGPARLRLLFNSVTR